MNVLYSGDGREELPTMISTSMSAGDRIYHRQAGGGGLGSPMERDPGSVVRDVKNGKVSVGQAREQYGVVIDRGTLALNEAETGKARRRSPAPDPVPEGGDAG